MSTCKTLDIWHWGIKEYNVYILINNNNNMREFNIGDKVRYLGGKEEVITDSIIVDETWDELFRIWEYAGYITREEILKYNTEEAIKKWCLLENILDGYLENIELEIDDELDYSEYLECPECGQEIYNSDSEEEKEFVVYVKGARAPRKVHTDFGKAMEEAERLCKSEGREAYVCERIQGFESVARPIL